MKTLILILAAALTVAAFAQVKEAPALRPIVTKTSTVEVKEQTRVVRIEVFGEDPENVRIVAHFQREVAFDGTTQKANVGWTNVSRSLPGDAKTEATVDGVTITRAQWVALGAAFAEADAAADAAVIAVEAAAVASPAVEQIKQ